MSGILKRTIYTTRIPLNGSAVFRFAEFASVVTSIGECWEPFTVNDIIGLNRAMPTGHDPKDMMRRIDDIDTFGPSASSRLMSAEDNGAPLHCMDQWLRNTA